MCSQCHSALKPHSKHKAGSEAARCVSCHMPKIMNSVMFPARTHEFDDIPDGEAAEKFGLAESPNACAGCHKDKGLGWIARQLGGWKK